MWELDYTESWLLKNWCFWTVVLEKTLESPLDCKEIPPVNPKGNQSWIFIGRTDAESETPILWPPDAKSWLIWKDLDAGKNLGQEEKGTTEDEMVGWHHWLDGHKFEQTPGVGDGQEAWHAAVHGVANSWIQLSDWPELNWTAFQGSVDYEGYSISSKLFCSLPCHCRTWNWGAGCGAWTPHSFGKTLQSAGFLLAIYSE